MAKRIGCLVLAAALLLAACGAEEDGATPDANDEPTATTPAATASNDGFVATVTAAAGLDAPTSTVVSEPEPTASPADAPGATETRAEPASESIIIVEVVGAPAGGEASLTVAVAPGTTCAIAYNTPSGTSSEAAGLSDATAGADGQITWRWSIGPATNPGEGRVTVTCGAEQVTTPITIS
jgi:hypothetical protein